MTNTLTRGVAAIAFSFGSAALLSIPAYAQDAQIEESEAAVEANSDDAAMESVKIVDTADDLMMEKSTIDMSDAETAIETPDEWDEMKADDATHPDARMSTESHTVTIDCPKGTEAQDDGTCMVVGEWGEFDETEDSPDE